MKGAEGREKRGERGGERRGELLTHSKESQGIAGGVHLTRSCQLLSAWSAFRPHIASACVSHWNWIPVIPVPSVIASVATAPICPQPRLQLQQLHQEQKGRENNILVSWKQGERQGETTDPAESGATFAPPAVTSALVAPSQIGVPLPQICIEPTRPRPQVTSRDMCVLRAVNVHASVRCVLCGRQIPVRCPHRRVRVRCVDRRPAPA